MQLQANNTKLSTNQSFCYYKNMQNLTNIEINTVAGGVESAASFFRSAAAQKIHEERLHHDHRVINTALVITNFVVSVGIKIITTIVYTTAALITLVYLCVKDTHINNHHKDDYALQ